MYNADYYERRKASGLCVRCACEAQDGRHVICRKCRAKDRARRAAEKARFDNVRHNMI